MKKYLRPGVELVTFDIEDVITSSGNIVNSSTLKGEDANIYKVYSQNSEVGNTNVSVFRW